MTTLKETMIDRRAFGSLLLPAMTLGPAIPTAAAQSTATVGCPPSAEAGIITKEAFSRYIAAFNRKDFAEFGQYYAENVLLELNAEFQLDGREAILDFYRRAMSHVKESVQVRLVIASVAGLAAELETEFHALDDWPDFPSGPMKKGDLLRRIGFVHYTVRENKFNHIKVALFKVLYRGPSA